MVTSFAELGLNEQILSGVDALGFTHPTPVQADAIPEVLQGHDLVASAQTGTGKTAAFVLPVLQLIGAATADQTALVVAAPEKGGKGAEKKSAARGRNRRGRRPQKPEEPLRVVRPARPSALVVTPTRELAAQIEEVATTVCDKTGQRAVILMGGARFDRQLKALEKGCDLLVATPGRLLDLMERDAVDLSSVQVFVLDEADRMLDMGFWPSVRRIIKALPESKQTLLFSATIPPSIKGTIDALLHNPALVEIAHVGETAETVEEALMPVVQGQKIELLQALVDRHDFERVLVFVRTKVRADQLEKSLQGAGLSVDVMHSDRPQKARERALESFREGGVRVLVATDVMSRGIDVSGIDAVVNFDVPSDPEDYVHRIGRTGRAGHEGHAYTFVAPDEITPLREIEYFTKKLVPVRDLDGFTYAQGRIVPNDRRSTVKPRRTMFSGSRSRGRGPSGGRYGRHS